VVSGALGLRFERTVLRRERIEKRIRQSARLTLTMDLYGPNQVRQGFFFVFSFVRRNRTS
jgi:hypothetical protein